MLCFFRLLEMLLKKWLEIEFKMSNSNLNSVYDKTHIQLIVALQFLFCACQNIGIRLSHFWRCHFIFEWFYEDASPACASQHSGRRTSRNTEMDSWVRKSVPQFFSAVLLMQNLAANFSSGQIGIKENCCKGLHLFVQIWRLTIT